MRRNAIRQTDLFFVVEPPEGKIAKGERAHLLHLLGELLWSVLDAASEYATSKEETSDE